jgi:hypothetical protein
MPKNWADRAIMFSVVALVAWAIIGLPLFNSFSWADDEPAQTPTNQHSTNKTKAEEPWLTKDAAGFFTFLVFVVGGIQVMLFLWQLSLIRESLVDAKTAADAAKESADATAQIARSERAWMIFHRVGQFPFENATVKDVIGPQTGIGFQIEWINAGRSPANRLTAYSVGAVVRIDELPRQYESDWTAATHTMPVGQGRVMFNTSFPLYGENLEGFQRREVKVFLYGAVRYFDVYEPTAVRLSESCIEVVFDGYQTDAQGRRSPHLQIMPAGIQNTIS